MAGSGETSAPEALHCYRHPDRETLLSCSNCERPICTSCMTQAAVGVRCPECSGRGGRTSVVRPIRGVRTGAQAAIATGALVAINAVLFVSEIATNHGGSLWNLGGSDVAQDGGIVGPAIADGEVYRIVTGGFLHINLIHLAFNMYILWILGGALERYAGAGRMLAIYFSAILWGSAGALLLAPDSLTVGASGGVFGLMAALYLLERQRGVALLGSSVGGLLLLNLVFTFAIPGVSWGGHIGGLLGGAAAGYVLSGFGRGHLAYGRVGIQGWAAASGLLVLAVIASLVIV